MHLVQERIRRPKRKSLIGQAVLILMGIQVIVFCSFTAFELPTAKGSNLGRAAQKAGAQVFSDIPVEWRTEALERVPALSVLTQTPEKVDYSSYYGLAPCAILLGYILGPKLALISFAAFLVLGLAGPLIGLFPFSSGGGLDYWLEPGFGYLLGTLAGSWLCGMITQNRRTSVSQVLAVVTGLFVIHLCGATYLIGSYLYHYVVSGSKTYLEWQPWLFGYLRNFTWYALPWDVLFSVMLVGMAFPLRWLNNNLTSPDCGPPQKKVRYNRKELETMV